LGAGVIDELTEMGKDVLIYNPAAKSEIMNAQGKQIYFNMRAEAWSTAAQILSSGMLDEETNTVVECKNMYNTLREQLCIPSYKFRNGKIIIEKKEDIKKRLGRSPDHADTYVMALWAWSRLDYVDEDDFDDYREKSTKKRTKNPMRMC
jgi:hypothetical protein